MNCAVALLIAAAVGVVAFFVAVGVLATVVGREAFFYFFGGDQ